MANTRAGGQRGMMTNQDLYGDDYPKIIGRRGGTRSTSRPFKDPEKARAAANKRWQLWREAKQKT